MSPSLEKVMKMSSPEQKATPPEVPEGARVTGKGAVVRVLGCPVPKWARWPVAGAFMFFLIKGLVWIALGLLVWWRSGMGG